MFLFLMDLMNTPFVKKIQSECLSVAIISPLLVSFCFICWFFFFALLSAASSFSFCRASLEHTVSAEELSYQLPRHAGGSNLTWHDGRGQKTAHTRTVKLLQQPGTEGIQVWRCPHIQTKGNAEECFQCMWITLKCFCLYFYFYFSELKRPVGNLAS